MNFTKVHRPFEWKVDPDHRQDRKSGPVITYKLSPEELEKYKNIKGCEKPSMAGIERMKRKGDCEDMKISDEIAKRVSAGKDIYTIVDELVAEGNDKRVVARLATKFGYQSKKKQQKQIVAVTMPGIQDSGKREDCGTGAIRDTQDGKGRFDLITPEGLFRLARWYELGAKKYSDRNWEKGIPITRCISSAMRHLVKYLAGWKDEDHLAAVAWNVFAIMHFEKYKPELDDRPEWAKAGGQDA